MKPPICSVCSAHLDPPEGALVRFRRTAEDEAWYIRAAAPGFVGHPPNAAWFCAAHAAAASALAEGTLADALASLRKAAGGGPPRA